jgi:phage shock protein A
MLLESSTLARLASANTLLGGHMPGLMARASTIIKAKFNALLNRAENPAETLDYSYEEQLRQLQNVKRGIADVATAKKRLELQYTTMQQQVEKLDG